LKNYKRLEDFRVDGASFPQQFYPTKSGIIVNKKKKTPTIHCFIIIMYFRLFLHQKQLQLQQQKKQQ